MSRKIYLGNLNYATIEQSLRELLGRYGELRSVELGVDPLNGAPRGFAFAEFTDESAAEAAIEALNGADFEGRKLRVNAAQERAPRQRRG